MNVQPLSIASIQNNSRNKDVAFGIYSSSITEKSLRETMQVVKDEKGNAIPKDKAERVAQTLWNALEGLKAAYVKDKKIKVRTFLNNNNGRIMAIVQTTDNVVPKGPFGRCNAQVETRTFPLQYNSSILKQVGEKVNELKKQYASFI